MTTKDNSELLFKDKQNNVTNNGQYNNFTLNKNHQISSDAFSGRPKSVITERKVLDYDFANDSQTKKESHSWKRSTKDLSSYAVNNGFGKEDRLKKGETLSASTLSLYIKAYENSNETNLFETVGLKENDLIKKGLNAKQIDWNSIGVIQNVFEFSRQQESSEVTDPEIAQFSASQQLLSPAAASGLRPQQQHQIPQPPFQQQLSDVSKLNNMGFAVLKDEENEIVAQYASDIKEKKKSILQFIETLKDDFSNVDTQENGLTKLVFVLQKLPNDCLDETEVGSLLEFFLTRLEGSALRNGCVVTGIHHLILQSKNLPAGCEIPIFQSIYSESTVQCFTQPDRTELFEILDFFLKNRRQGLKSLGSEFILCFMRAANGERDPRCLLQIFQLYLDVVKDFDLGVYCEDFFELLAVYFPLEYTPADTLKVSREMLSSGLESCLLSHKSFSFYCYQLISSKFEEDDTEEDVKVEICGFLAKAAKIFPTAPMKPFLEDFLTVFRRLCLNPSNKSSNEIPMDIKNAILSILKAFENDHETIKSIANTMTENCEPFILQAEMGLTGKALSVLSVVSKGSKIAAEIILPQIMFWLGNLINADTVNAPQNRQEIIVEAITFLPDWLNLSIECECTQVVRDALPGFIESLKRTEEQFGSVVFPVEYKLSEILLTQASKFEGVSLPTKELYEKLVWRSVTDLKQPDEKLRVAIQNFVISFAKSDFEMFATLVEKEIASREMDSSLLELVALGICDEKSVEKFGGIIVEALKQGVNFDLSRCVIETIERNKDNNVVIEKLTDDLISAFIEGLENNEEISNEDAKIKAELLQQIVLKLDHSKVEKLADSFVAKWEATDGIKLEKLIRVTALSILQSKNIDILEKALNLAKLQSNLTESSNYLAFALSIYKQESAEPLSWISIKSSLLLNRPNALSNLESFFQTFISSSDTPTSHLSAIFDFDSAGFNPTLNRYPVSILWRQRILCQFIPIYVKYFSQISPSNSSHRSAFFELLSPILANAQKLTVPLSTELLQILPILTQALEVLAEEEGSPLLDLVIESFIQLLKQTSLDSISNEELEKNLKSLQKILSKPKTKMSTVIKVLEALELFGKNAPSEVVLPAFSGIIGALINATLSNKRIVRQKAAAVRNQWELAMS